MSEGSFWPKTWSEAVPLIVWGIFIFSFGLECVVNLVDGSYGRALFSLVGTAGLTAVLIHWDQLKSRLLSISANWLVAAFALLLMAIVFSPYVEQRKWPFSELINSNSNDILSSFPTKILSSDIPWLTVAFKEYEQARLVGPDSNPRILEYLRAIPGGEKFTDKDDWASAFAEWSLNRVGISGPKNMNPKAWVTWGRQIKTPQPGAIAVFNFDGTEHVGFVLTDTDNSLIILGGNQETRVEVRRYPKSKLVDLRMPLLSK